MSEYAIKIHSSTKTNVASSEFIRAGRFNLALLQIVFFGLLSTAYYYYLSDIYLSEGYRLIFNLDKFIIAAVVVFIFSYIVPSNRSLLNSLLHITCAVAVTPVGVFYSMGDRPDGYFISFCICVLVVYFFSFTGVYIRPVMKTSSKSLLNFLIIILGVFVASLFFYGASSYFNIDLATVYQYRRVIEDALPEVYGYLIPIFTKSILTFATYLACRNNNYLYILICIVTGGLIFGLTSHKSVTVYPLIVVALYYGSKKYNSAFIFLTMAIFATAVSLVDFYTQFAGRWIGYLVSGRAFLVPALLNYHYYEFFSDNPWYWWSGSKLSLGLLSMPYPQQPPFTIGVEIFNDPDLSANIGWFGSGYAQAGFFGAIIYSILLGLMFACFNSYAKRIGNILPVVIVHTLTALTSTDLLTLLLTDGLVVLLLLLNTLSGAEGRRTDTSRVPRKPAISSA